MTAKTFIPAILLTLLTSCVDNDYDLADIDTTVRVQANDLVIPISIDPILMESVVKINEGDAVTVYNGEYAVVRDGDFHSDPILVPVVDLPAPQLSASQTVIPVPSLPVSGSAGSISFDIATQASPYTYTSTQVSPFIVSIDEVGCNAGFTMLFTITGFGNYVNRFSVEDLVIQMPKGLHVSSVSAGTYNPSTGELLLPDQTLAPGGLEVTVKASAIDFAQAGGIYNYNSATLSISGSLYIKSGKIRIAASDIKPGVTLPQSLILSTEYTLTDIQVTTFSGRVKYSLDIADLTQVDLSNLPDVLAQQSTDISIVNPMLYLQITNPLQAYGIYARTGLSIDAWHGDQSTSYTLDDPYFQIGPSSADGVYNFVLSPRAPITPDAQFANPTHVSFTSLSRVLSGAGIPNLLDISLVDPGMPAQPVTDFRLGTSCGSLTGTYRLVAPLQFLPGSTVTYTHTIDGWSSEDLDALTVTALDVDLNISTDVPVEVQFTGYPIDNQGNRINNVNIEASTIPANAQNHHVTLHVTGEFSHLDGLIFTAVATAAQSDQALSPSMTISVTDIRPRVSGYYDRTL